jgi:hypothetical protein
VPSPSPPAPLFPQHVAAPPRRQNTSRATAVSHAAKLPLSLTGTRYAIAGSTNGRRTQSPSCDSIEVFTWVHTGGSPEVAVHVSEVPVGANSRTTAMAKAWTCATSTAWS